MLLVILLIAGFLPGILLPKITGAVDHIFDRGQIDAEFVVTKETIVF